MKLNLLRRKYDKVIKKKKIGQQKSKLKNKQKHGVDSFSIKKYTEKHK